MSDAKTKPPKAKAKPAKAKAKAVAAASPAAADPTGCCRFVNAAGVNDCIDGLTKTECGKIPNSMFFVGKSCI